MYVCMYVCMYVRTYVRTYVCMYVCMYVQYSSVSTLHTRVENTRVCVHAYGMQFC